MRMTFEHMHLERYDNNMIRIGVTTKRQEAGLPLREQGVSFVLSSHHNATHGIFFLSFIIRYVWDF